MPKGIANHRLTKLNWIRDGIPRLFTMHDKSTQSTKVFHFQTIFIVLIDQNVIFVITFIVR